jgi:hypothetical protein
LNCGSPLPLLNAPLPVEKRQKTGALQNLSVFQSFREFVRSAKRTDVLFGRFFLAGERAFRPGSR